MKQRKILIIACIALFFLIAAEAGLLAGYWIANDCASDQQLILEPESGTFLAFRPEFSIFDIHGSLLRQGTFHEPDGALIELEDTVKLADGTFFSLAFMYNEASQIADPYKIIRFTRDAEVLWVKRLSIDRNLYHLRRVCAVGNVLKVLGAVHQNGQDRIVILTFSMEGELLGTKTSRLQGDDYRNWSGDIEVTGVDDMHYSIVQCGGNRDGQNAFYGALLLKLDVNDAVVLSKMVFFDGAPDTVFDIADVEYKDGEYHLLALENKTAYFFKLDSNGQPLRTKRYDVGPRIELNWDCHIRKVDNGYWFGLSTEPEDDGDLGSCEPILVRTDIYGNPLWSKQYDYAGYHGIFSFQPMPGEGLFFGTNGRTFYMLDQNGDVPGGCQVYQPISVTAVDVHPTVNNLTAADVQWSASPSLTIETIEGEYVDDSGCDGFAGDPFCRYDTMTGNLDTIIERSLFMGFVIHVLDFSIDPIIASYVEKFEIYRVTGSGDLQQVMMTEAQDGKTAYHVELGADNPLDAASVTAGYRVTALDSSDAVIDFVEIED